MTKPRQPLITGVVNDITGRDFNTIPTSYAVNQLFSGEPIDPNESLNDIIKCGNYRFTGEIGDLPDHLQGKTGILTVLHDRVEETDGEFGVSDPSAPKPTAVRQILWPDGPEDITPYTRTGMSYGGQVFGWCEWATMGGNLRRVKLLMNTNAQINVLYYSFGNYTLTLPDPSIYPLGTRIGLEQYSGTGTVKWQASTQSILTQITTPAYAADDSGEPTTDIIGPNVYYFEIVEDNNGNRQWILDVDNDISNTITNIRGTIGREILDRKAAIDAEASARANADTVLDNRISANSNAIAAEEAARIAADTAEANARISAVTAKANALIADDNVEYRQRVAADNTEAVNRAVGDTNTLNLARTYTDNLIANKDKLHKVFYVTTAAIKTSVPNEGETGYNSSYCFADGNGYHWNINELLKLIHPTFVLSTTCTAVYIPVAAEMYLGSELTIEIWKANQTVNIYESNNPSVTSGNEIVTFESFTNNTDGVLTLPFECVYNTSNNTYAWKLLSL